MDTKENAEPFVMDCIKQTWKGKELFMDFHAFCSGFLLPPLVWLAISLCVVLDRDGTSDSLKK